MFEDKLKNCYPNQFKKIFIYWQKRNESEYKQRQ